VTTRSVCIAACALLAMLRSTSEGLLSTQAPEMVGEGTVSTAGDEFGGTLSADGRTLYFTRSIPPHYLYTLCVSKLNNGKWLQPELLPFSGVWRDSDPVLSPDGKRLYFVSDRPVCVVPTGGASTRSAKPVCEDRHNFDIYVSKMVGGQWRDPERLPEPVNSAQTEFFVSEAANGNLYFTSDREGSQGVDVYVARYSDGRYEAPENLGGPVNGGHIANIEAFIAPDESYLLLGTFGRPGSGSADLYVSLHQHGAWTEPKNLGSHINSSARDYSPRVSPDGEWLFFGSERGGFANRVARLTYGELRNAVASVHNGLGNIYRVPMSEVLDLQNQ
jgi:Tol biopolymer transport system component